MMVHIKKMIYALLLICVVFLYGCGPSLEFQYKKAHGLYPDASDFRDTKWICRELDIVLNVFELTEHMVGTYKVNSESYRAVVSFEFDQIQLNFYSSTEVSKSENSNSMVHCEPVLCGYIYATYFFDKGTETIVCSINSSMSVNSETIPQELTFEKVGVIQLEREYRWHAQELDMYLDSFIGVDGYYSGEIILGDEKIYINALEVGNNNYYALSIENGILNKLKPETTSPLINMYFQIENDRITAMVCDDYSAEAFPYWWREDTIITLTYSADNIK